MSTGQELGIHQADLLLPRDVTVQSDGEVVRRHQHLLGRQHHGARVGPEDALVLFARRVVAGKSVCQRPEAIALARPLLLLSWGPYPHPCPLSPAQVGLGPQPHLVKRSQGLGPCPSSGADQWQSILRMLLVRQVKVPAPSPGNSDHWEPIVAASGQGWRMGKDLAANILTGQSRRKIGKSLKGRAGRPGVGWGARTLIQGLGWRTGHTVPCGV